MGSQVVVSYCKIDYPSLLEATQLRMHSLKAQLKKLAQDRCAFREPGWLAAMLLCSNLMLPASHATA